MNEKELLGTYKLVIGLEIHMQPKTSRKMFCRCDADIWKSEPNTHTCPVCLGLPGALPVPNYDAVKKTQLFGLALHCSLNKNSKFDRKHYFYPDLPKGYQISQYKEPLCIDGWLDLNSGAKADIERIHLEEDVAKSFHEHGKTLIDFNKSGLPLIELVTRPTFTNLDDAVDYCKQVQNIARTIGISDADMEKGQMRLEANISLRTAEMESKGELANYKVEIKNINSFRFMEKAVKAEIIRQREVLEKGGELKQENRGYNEATGKTVLQRSKEEAKDYRYFPEPDIPPMVFTDEYIENLKKELPELPYQIKERYQEVYKLDAVLAVRLVDQSSMESRAKFEELVKKGLDAKKVANAIINNKDLSELENNTNFQAASISEDELISLAEKVIAQNPKAVEDYKGGKLTSVEFLLGMCMRELKGKVQPNQMREVLIKKLAA